MAHRYPGHVSIYPARALTNIVVAVPMDPQFASLAKDLEIMGGYVDLNMSEVTCRCVIFLQLDSKDGLLFYRQ
jgi:inosine-uridine nucleoside N-ribohydrolase